MGAVISRAARFNRRLAEAKLEELTAAYARNSKVLSEAEVR